MAPKKIDNIDERLARLDMLCEEYRVQTEALSAYVKQVDAAFEQRRDLSRRDIEIARAQYRTVVDARRK